MGFDRENSALNFIFTIAFLIVVATAGFFVIDPVDMMNAKKDEKLSTEASTILRAIYAYFDNKGVSPWANITGSKLTSPPLSWTQANQEKVGICANDKCTKGSYLTEDYYVIVPGDPETQRKTYLPDGYLDNFVKEKIGEDLYVGKGSSTQSQTYVCFIPSSKKLRKSTGQLYKLSPGASVSNLGPESCDDSVTWKEDDACWKCVSK